MKIVLNGITRRRREICAIAVTLSRGVLLKKLTSKNNPNKLKTFSCRPKAG